MAGEKTLWSVGGGKGGVGKSITTANLGCALALKGHKVVLVDADLGGANLHTYFGIKFPPKGLDDFLKGRIPSLEDAAIETQVKGLSLISGGGEFLGIANPAYSQKQKLITHIKKLDAEYILVDLGAGSTFNILDFFAVSNEGIVVLVPEPAAIQNAYVFLKSFVYRRLARLFSEDGRISAMIKDATDGRSSGAVKTFSDLCGRIASSDREAAGRALAEIKGFRPRLILNMAASPEDLKVVDSFRSAASAFLSLDTEYAGVLYSRPTVKAAARKMRPFMLDPNAAEAHRDMEAIVERLTRPQASLEHAGEKAVEAKEAVHAGEEEVFGFNDNVSSEGSICHVQTEVQGGASPSIETVIYHGGRIFFSKKTLWKEADAPGASLKDFAAKQHRAAIAAIKLGKISLKG